MTLKSTATFSALIAALILATALIAVNVRNAGASASGFVEPDCATAPATTTLTYLTAGTATTTVTCPIAVNTYAADSASLLIQLTASSTATQLAWKYEYSQDGINWYAQDEELSSLATSTVHARTHAENTWVFASSTPGAVTSPQGRALKIVDVPTPTKYVRVVFYLPPGSLNGAVWAQLIGKRQI